MKLIQPSRSSFQNLIDAAFRFIQWMVLGDRPHEEPIMPKNGQVGSCRMDFHAAIAVLFFTSIIYPRYSDIAATYSLLKRQLPRGEKVACQQSISATLW